MANKEPKTMKGRVRKLLGGKGNEKTETAIRRAFDKPVTTVDKELRGKRKKGKTK